MTPILVNNISEFIIGESCEGVAPCVHQGQITLLSGENRYQRELRGDAIYVLARAIDDKSKIIGDYDHCRGYANFRGFVGSSYTRPTLDEVLSDFLPRNEENLSPRGEEDLSPRGEEDLSPRGEEDLSPRGEEDLSPRGEDLPFRDVEDLSLRDVEDLSLDEENFLLVMRKICFFVLKFE